MSGDLLGYSYGVCERQAGGIFAEPLNLLTNAGFIGVAIALFCYYRRHSDLKGMWIVDIHVLTGLVFCIGVCSSVFHAFPSATTEMLDMLAIVAFINVFFISTMVRIVRCGWFETAVCYMAFAGSTHILVQPSPMQ